MIYDSFLDNSSLDSVKNIMERQDSYKLKHDFINSIVIINSIAKSASSLVEKISNETTVSDRQIVVFRQSMKLIQNEAIKVEKMFDALFDQLLLRGDQG